MGYKLGSQQRNSKVEPYLFLKKKSPWLYLTDLKSIERYGGNPEPRMQGVDIREAVVMVELEGGVQADGGEGEGYEM